MPEILVQVLMLLLSLTCACFFIWNTRPGVLHSKRDAYASGGILCMTVLLALLLPAGPYAFRKASDILTLLPPVITVSTCLLMCLLSAASMSRSQRLLGTLVGVAYMPPISSFLHRFFQDCMIEQLHLLKNMHDRLVTMDQAMLVLSLIAWMLVCWRASQYGEQARLRHLASQNNLCLKCNYSLRGLPPGASCPECGQAARKPEQKPATTPAGPGDKPAPSI